MSWERIVKKDKGQWLDLSEVILGEFDYAIWKDKPIPEELIALKKGYDSLTKEGQDAIQQLLEIGLEETDENRKQIFTLITAVIEVE